MKHEEEKFPQMVIVTFDSKYSINGENGVKINKQLTSIKPKENSF